MMAIRYLFTLLLIFPNLSSGQVSRIVEPDQIPENKITGKYHAIIISVDQYRDDQIKDLAQPKIDADKLSLILEKKYYFRSEDIIRLTDPTRANILDAIESKRSTLSIDDNLVIFYAGHGFWDKSLKMGYWLPADALKNSKSNWVSNNDLTTYLAAFQTNHVLVISDACFSGGIFKTRGLGVMDEGTKRLYELKSRKAITSGNLEEVPDNSVFMKYFLNELEKNRAVFLSSDQLFSKILPIIRNNSNTLPLYGTIQNTGDEGGEFIFYNAGDSSENTNPEQINLMQTIRSHEKKIALPTIGETNKKLKKNQRAVIISFDNTSGKVSDYGDLGGPLRDMLTTDLKQVQNLTMVDRQSLEKILTEQKLNNSKNFDPATASKIGKLLGAEIIITGTYFEFMGSLRIDAKFIDAETGEISQAVGVEGAWEKLFDLKKSLANAIIEKINL